MKYFLALQLLFLSSINAADWRISFFNEAQATQKAYFNASKEKALFVAPAGIEFYNHYFDRLESGLKINKFAFEYLIKNDPKRLQRESSPGSWLGAMFFISTKEKEHLISSSLEFANLIKENETEAQWLKSHRDKTSQFYDVFDKSDFQDLYKTYIEKRSLLISEAKKNKKKAQQDAAANP